MNIVQWHILELMFSAGKAVGKIFSPLKIGKEIILRLRLFGAKEELFEKGKYFRGENKRAIK